MSSGNSRSKSRVPMSCSLRIALRAVARSAPTTSCDVVEDRRRSSARGRRSAADWKATGLVLLEPDGVLVDDRAVGLARSR